VTRSTQNMEEEAEKMPTSRRDFIKVAGTGALGLIVGGAAGYTIANSGFAAERSRGTQSQEMLTEYFASWNAHDVEKIASFVTDDIICYNGARDQTFHGKDQLKGWAKGSFDAIPDFKLDMTSLFASGDMLASEWVFTRTLSGSLSPRVPPTGKSFSVRGSTIAQMKDGKIQREADYWDIATFLRQVGLMT
jgi:steroid delta-isomerase-like uncharacterized protein